MKGWLVLVGLSQFLCGSELDPFFGRYFDYRRVDHNHSLTSFPKADFLLHQRFTVSSEERVLFIRRQFSVPWLIGQRVQVRSRSDSVSHALPDKHFHWAEHNLHISEGSLCRAA